MPLFPKNLYIYKNFLVLFIFFESSFEMLNSEMLNLEQCKPAKRHIGKRSVKLVGRRMSRNRNVTSDLLHESEMCKREEWGLSD